MAAFQEGEFEAAKRLTIEILTEDPGHAGARALRTRIDARLRRPARGAGADAICRPLPRVFERVGTSRRPPPSIQPCSSSAWIARLPITSNRP